MEKPRSNSINKSKLDSVQEDKPENNQSSSVLPKLNIFSNFVNSSNSSKSNETSSKAPRKAIASTEVVKKEPTNIKLAEQDKKSQNQIEPVKSKEEASNGKITYAEYYLKTKRSGSLALPVSQFNQKQIKGFYIIKL